MIYTRGNSAPAKTNSPSRSLVPAITCTEYCTSQEVDRGHHIFNRPLGALPAHVGQNANLTCCLLYLLNKRRGNGTGESGKATKAKTACEQDKKNGRFHVKFLSWNEGGPWDGMGGLCTTCIGRPHAPHARTHVRTIGGDL